MSLYSTIGMEEFRKMLPWPHQVKTSGISHSSPTAPVEQTEQVHVVYNYSAVSE